VISATACVTSAARRLQLTMIVVLALGIGFNTALFIFIYSLVNGPLPGVLRG
jgi:hypothetical protein